jgi:hypothetical protein
MNCEQCQELVSAYLDGELDETGSTIVREHLAVCVDCSVICEDLAMLLDVTRFDSDESAVPPNPQALWCRINNIIEGEVNAEIAKEQKAHQTESASGWSPRSWNLSFSQVAAAVAGIALISSLLTFIVVKQYVPANGDLVQSSEPTIVDRVLGKFGLVETPQALRKRKMLEREAAINYWDQRVQARRVQWDAHLREVFDRNLNEINQAVAEYSLILEENPQDELSGEMLDTVMTEKMELLREFSEL